MSSYLQGVCEHEFYIHWQGIFAKNIELNVTRLSRANIEFDATVRPAHLKEREEVVQLLLMCTMIKTHPTGIQQHADQPDAEEIVRHVNRTRLTW